ncbi:MAG: adenylate/guanylate cyclase domain-containing protein [Pseudomonadota bacterium]
MSIVDGASTAREITDWLIAEGRELGEGIAVVDQYVQRLVDAGIPLSRVNVAQRFANPLLVAWGVIWTPDGSHEYDVTHAMLDTASYVGSPFETVLTTEKPLHKSLLNLDREVEHSAYLELADGGGADLYANFLRYGDGSKNGCTFVTDDPDGFTPEHIRLIDATAYGLASAMEPITMRRSIGSLLKTYIGDGPARAVSNGSIQRGEHASIEAVVMFTDLRGFTSKSEQWADTKLLDALNSYFDVVVLAVEKHDGDVLKFMGDGILSVFAIDGKMIVESQCRNAIDAARMALEELDVLNTGRLADGEEVLSIGIGINVGSVTFGNIGSPDRLDFTVLGSAVNIASRVQDLCKALDTELLVTQSVASCRSEAFEEKGAHPVRGIAEPIPLFGLKR